MPVTGPVRQDDTVPKKELIIDPIPQATVKGLIRVWWPADFRIARPCPFWINKTVIAKGITNSMLAFKLNSGLKIVGIIGDKLKLLKISAWLEFKIIKTPTIKDPKSGGIILCSEGKA